MCEKLSGIKNQAIADLQLKLSNNDLNFADKYLLDNRITEQEIVIGFHPGCSPLKNHERRRWETEKFSALGKKLINDFNIRILLFGGKEENDLKEKVINGINSNKALSVKTSTLLESAAIMKRCNVFVTNDSSLMHIASALKLNVVALIGPTNINYIKPWNTKHKIVSLNLECSPCFYYSPKPLTCIREDIKFKCIKDLSVDLAYAKVTEFLSNRTSN
jgi:heptosyltransferase-2